MRLCGASILLALGLLAPAARAASPIRLGLIESPLHSRADLQPVAEWLAQHTGHPVELVAASDYRDLSARIEKGDVEVAVLFPVAVARALQRVPPVQILACSVRQGKPSYRGYFITRQSGDVRTLSDLRGKRMGFVDETSTSGFFYPLQVLRKEGFVKDRAGLESFFGSVVFLGSHEKVMRAVADGTVDAGAVYDLAIRRGVEAGIDAGSLRILGRTDPIPHEAIAATPGLDPALAVLIRDALLALDTRTEAGRRVLLPMATRLDGFVPCDEHVFDAVRDLVEEER